MALCFFLAGSAASQTKSVSELETEISAFQNIELFSVRYDDRKDATILNLSIDLLLEEPKLQNDFKEFTFELSSIYTGIGIDEKPYRTLICTNSKGKKFYFASNRELLVSFGDRPFSVGEAQRTTEVRGKKVTENLCWDIAQSLVREIGSAKTMTLTIGRIVIPISPEKVSAFGNYSKLLLYPEDE
ncbi:MAG: hypothetical protein KDB79_15470 [Acidobacteria bacterium]|nr:hypothetical protein [Acidobacteriota bacterium]